MNILHLTTFIGFLTVAFASEEIFLPRTSKLCRNVSPENVIYRWHNQTRACYAVGSRGPCGDLMIFYADPNSEDEGQCDCDLKYRCNRPMIYWPPLDRCFLAYDQGPCQRGSWLVFGNSLEPTCQRNPCTISHSEFDDDLNGFWFTNNRGQCTFTGTRGQCPLSNEKTLFNGFSQQVGPFCSPITFTCVLPEIPCLICVPGQKWHMENGCKLWDPNFKHSLRFHSNYQYDQHQYRPQNIPMRQTHSRRHHH